MGFGQLVARGSSVDLGEPGRAIRCHLAHVVFGPVLPHDVDECVRGHFLRDPSGGELRPRGLLPDIPVLAEYATEVAAREENRSRPVPTVKTILLAEMGAYACHARVTSRAASPRLPLQPVDAAVLGTRMAIPEPLKGPPDAVTHFARSLEREIRGLERIENKPRVSIVDGDRPFHDSQLYDAKLAGTTGSVSAMPVTSCARGRVEAMRWAGTEPKPLDNRARRPRQ